MGLPRLAWAIAVIDEFLARLPGSPRSLNKRELREYRSLKPVAGWRLQVTFADGPQDLDVLVDNRFPRTQPRVALVGISRRGKLPHVDKEGVLCLLPDVAGTDPFEPVLVLQNVLSAAVGLLEDILAGNREDDFRDEFHSYWELECTDIQLPIRSLLVPRAPSRRIRIWRGTTQYAAGENEEEVLRWLANLFGDGGTDRTTDEGLFLWIEKPLIPAEYPKTGGHLLELARVNGAEELLRDLVVKGTEEIVALIGSATRHGPCLAAVHLLPPANGPYEWSSVRRVDRGFRTGKVPKQLIQARFISSAIVSRRAVDRIDPAWIHGRGVDERAQVLQRRTVAILGCGSIGAPVALLLARAGVGNLVLIDPKKLSWPNVGRHPLGAGSVDRYKAEDLSERLLRDLPHMRSARAFNQRWEEVLVEQPEVLGSCDLIVSTMGDWPSEGALNEWHIRTTRAKPIVYGWTEAEAVAGHAVALLGDGGCLQCGFDHHGTPVLSVVEWADERLHQEPGCGALFQPYGPVEAANVVNLVAELCLDAMLGQIRNSTHRVWVAGQARLAAAGGRWTEAWTRLVGPPTRGAFVEERPWLRSATCLECTPRSATRLAIQASA